MKGKKIILAPDSFKGTMSAVRVCDIMERAIHTRWGKAEIAKVPVADGGEGTVDCFVRAMDAERITATVSSPFFERMEAAYARLPDGVTAVIEMAAAAGLPLVEDRKNPTTATTYGVGELIRHAVESGCRKIILGLGGSCTNDGGAGMAAALGVRFYDDAGHSFVPTGGTLDRIARIDCTGKWPVLNDCCFTTMCDVRNPLCGPNGASAVFGPQKGADEEMVRTLDRNLLHFSQCIREDCGMDVEQMEGAGAAGGLGGGSVVFLGAQLRSGIDTVLDTVGFDRLLEGADLVISGEGRIDGQSAQGKVVWGISRRAKAAGVPVVAVVGDIGDGIDALYGEGLTAVISINRRAIPFEQARLRCETDLEGTVDTLIRLLEL